MIEIFLLVIALCVDEMVASMAYGADGIRLRIKDMLLMNFISTVFLGLALCLGNLFVEFINLQSARIVGFVCLLFLGILKLSDYFIKSYINKHTQLWKNFSFSLSGLRFIISIYGNPTVADKDDSHTLSVKETFFLSCAMSIDSLTVGFMASFLGLSIPLSIGMTFFIGFLFVFTGYQLGRKIVTKTKKDLSWLCGVFLILLALSKSL